MFHYCNYTHIYRNVESWKYAINIWRFTAAVKLWYAVSPVSEMRLRMLEMCDFRNSR